MAHEWVAGRIKGLYWLEAHITKIYFRQGTATLFFVCGLSSEILEIEFLNCQSLYLSMYVMEEGQIGHIELSTNEQGQVLTLFDNYSGERCGELVFESARHRSTGKVWVYG